MNMNQIINMVLRTIMRKAINSGVNAGLNAASGVAQKRKPSQPAINDSTGMPEQPGNGKPKLTPEQRQAKQAVRQARRAAKMAKRTSGT